MTAAAKPQRREYVVSTTRLYAAPRERVFECWTRAEHLAHWFAPGGFTIHSVEADARAGGTFQLVMRAPDGGEHQVRGRYREVSPPDHLVIDCRATDENDVERLDEVIRVSFASEGGGTRLTLHAVAGGEGPEAARMLGGMERGWSETLDRLGERANAKPTEK